MFEHKYTDEELTKILECCITSDGCKNCINSYKGDMCQNVDDVVRQAIASFNRQKAEIEDLEIKNEHLVCFLAEARRDAIKEVFAKLRANEIKPEFPWDDFYITDSQLEEIEKEMTEEKR